MEREEQALVLQLNKKTFQIFKDFMSRVAQFEELVAIGSRLLVGFHQGSEFLRRPTISTTSDLVECIIRANKTRRLLRYFEAGCVNAHDSIQNISTFLQRVVHTCGLGLQDNITRAKCIVNELEGLVKEATDVIETVSRMEPHLQNKVNVDEFCPESTTYNKEIVSSHLREPEITDYAATMWIMCNMLKQEFIMQETIISSLNLKSSSGELETYSLMWSLRPYVNDEIVHQAWGLIR